MWWVFAELGRQLGYDLGTLGDPASSTDDDVLAVLLAGARAKYDEVAATGWAEAARELPAPGSTGTSGGWAGGGWRRSCWSISSPHLSHPRRW